MNTHQRTQVLHEAARLCGGYEVPEGSTLHIQRAATHTGYIACELYRGLRDRKPQESWALTLERNPGALYFLVPHRDAPSKGDGWFYDLYRMHRDRAMRGVLQLAGLAMTNDLDKLVALHRLDSLDLDRLGTCRLHLNDYEENHASTC
jgi:hypothetical protein